MTLRRTPDTTREITDGVGLGEPIAEKGRRAEILDGGVLLFAVEGFVEADAPDAQEVRDLEDQVLDEAHRRFREGDWNSGGIYGLES